MTCTVPNMSLSAFNPDNIVDLWMLPIQLGLNSMNSGLSILLSAVPRAKAMTDQATESVPDVTRAVEEQIAGLDEGRGDTIPTPAALIA